MPKAKTKSTADITKLYKKSITAKRTRTSVKAVKVEKPVAAEQVETVQSVRPVEAQPEKIDMKLASGPFSQVSVPEKSGRKNIGKMIVVVVMLLMLISLTGATIYFYKQWKDAKADPQVLSQQDIASITAKLGKFIDLPAGETPTLATVTNIEKLKDQPFFAHAQNGDKALVYATAGKAILYRPSTNRIIEIISLTGNIPGSQSPAEQTTQPAPAPDQAASQTQSIESEPATATDSVQAASVAVYNGTDQKGLAKTIGTKAAQISGVTIATTGNAKGVYVKTIVIDLSGKNSELAKKIAESLGGEIGSLPGSEAKPDADILVIAGGDSITK